MDAQPTQRPSTIVVLEMSRTPDGRLEGHLRSQATDVARAFSGVLEFLKVLEETLDLHEGVAPIDPKEASAS